MLWPNLMQCLLASSFCDLEMVSRWAQEPFPSHTHKHTHTQSLCVLFSYMLNPLSHPEETADSSSVCRYNTAIGLSALSTDSNMSDSCWAPRTDTEHHAICRCLFTPESQSKRNTDCTYAGHSQMWRGGVRVRWWRWSMTLPHHEHMQGFDGPYMIRVSYVLDVVWVCVWCQRENRWKRARDDARDCELAIIRGRTYRKKDGFSFFCLYPIVHFVQIGSIQWCQILTPYAL